MGSSALLANTGNQPAPVYALYLGELSESVLADNHDGIIRLAALGEGMQILVYTATLAAEAPGALSRASYILPGSRPMVDPGGHLVAVVPAARWAAGRWRWRGDRRGHDRAALVAAGGAGAPPGGAAAR